MHNGNCVGQLSKSSSIVRQMQADEIEELTGFFVSDIFYWTYQDTLDADQRATQKTGINPNYASKWCDEARKQGFIFIVDIAGYGK